MLSSISSFIIHHSSFVPSPSFFVKVLAVDLSKYWTLSKVAHACQGRMAEGAEKTPIKGISIDSRKIKKGELFWAITGERFDGNLFVAQAARNGAIAAVLSREPEPTLLPKGLPFIKVGNSTFSLGAFAREHRLLFKNANIVAVTGSNGKTTTKELIASVLSEGGTTLKSPENHNNEIGCPLALLELTSKHKFAVLELAARRPGDIKHLSCVVHPFAAVLTNIGSAHLQTFGNIEHVFRAKSEILSGLDPAGYVIYNADDPLLGRLPKMGYAFHFANFALNHDADYKGQVLDINPDTIDIEVFIKGKSACKMSLNSPSLPFAKSAMAAFTCGVILGIKPKYIAEALGEENPPDMRGERFILNNKSIVVNDAYNANPSSMLEGSISFLNAYRESKRLLVLGEMRELGSQEATLHWETGSFIIAEAIRNGTLDENVEILIVGNNLAIELASGVASQKDYLAKPPILLADKKDAVKYIQDFIQRSEKPCAIYFKASRLENFEDIINKIKVK
ncbi:UDP-N-acetylmuramoyl-tripeptide--D-alanyl-D-alanine ligase [Elusimicrobiota bacterium]